MVVTMQASDFEPLENMVKRHVMDALTLTQGNQRQAAALLGVTRWKLARLIVRLGLQDFVRTIRSASALPTGAEHSQSAL
jgi:transcriptional regulator with GAF, ATPase, and Fis domain